MRTAGPIGPRLSVAAVATGFIAGCASGGPHFRGPGGVEPAPIADIVHTVLLVGDAGYARPGGPVLREAARQAAVAPTRTTVVFLGDIVYPAGLPASTNPTRPSADTALLVQIEVPRLTGAAGIFLAGNHDWANGRPNGLDAVQRLGSFIREWAGNRTDIRMVPEPGCPGPTAIPLSGGGTLIALDTEWWFFDGPKSTTPEGECIPSTEEGVLDSLSALLARSAPPVIVVGHHPLESAGHHGGYFGWDTHIFPLREFARWLWIPLPGIGSLYPLIRRIGIADQDLASGRYGQFRRPIDSVLTMHRPLVYAAGHEHNLQVMEGTSARYLIVSGAGPSRRVEPVGRLTGTLYARGAPGLIRLDLLRDGRVRLAAVVIGGGEAREEYSTWLTTQ